MNMQTAKMAITDVAVTHRQMGTMSVAVQYHTITNNYTKFLIICSRDKVFHS